LGVSHEGEPAMAPAHQNLAIILCWGELKVELEKPSFHLSMVCLFKNTPKNILGFVGSIQVLGEFSCMNPMQCIDRLIFAPGINNQPHY
jgi:hypothetical protein